MVGYQYVNGRLSVWLLYFPMIKRMHSLQLGSWQFYLYTLSSVYNPILYLLFILFLLKKAPILKSIGAVKHSNIYILISFVYKNVCNIKALEDKETVGLIITGLGLCCTMSYGIEILDTMPVCFDTWL